MPLPPYTVKGKSLGRCAGHVSAPGAVQDRGSTGAMCRDMAVLRMRRRRGEPDLRTGEMLRRQLLVWAFTGIPDNGRHTFLVLIRAV